VNKAKYWIGTFLSYIRKDTFRVMITIVIGGFSLLIFAITFQILKNTTHYPERNRSYIFVKGKISKTELKKMTEILKERNIKIYRIITPEYKLRYLYGEKIPEELLKIVPLTIVADGGIGKRVFPAELQKYIEKISSVAPGESKIRKMAGMIRTFLIIFSITLIGGIIVITIFTIQLSFISHHEEIEILKLLGADSIFISVPLFLEGIFIGTGSGLLAVVFFILMKAAWQKYPANLISPDFATMGTTILLGIATGVISSFLSIVSRRHDETG